MGRLKAMNAGLDRLQEFLLEMMPGDDVSVDQARKISGLDGGTCEAVLDALKRAGLMLRLPHDTFLRVRLEEPDPAMSDASLNTW